MSVWELFALGCAGGLAAYAALYLGPEFRQMKKTGNFHPTLRWIVGLIGIATVMIGLGGVAAWLFGDNTTSAKHAFLFGVGGETSVSALAQQAARGLERLR